MSITVTHLSKRFNLYARPLHRFKEWATLGRRSYHTAFWALRDVNLAIPSGASTGIIGPNGAGKSTLLKIITGTLFPTEGEAKVEGRVAALLELGTGFHPEFTGRLNIYLNGKMLGLSDDEIAEKFDEIVSFSELGNFIEQPIRTYSSGMTMRLGFSIASCVDPDVLIIDEALSVGDAYFSQKCVRRIREFRERGVTILFVSHDPSAVLTLCDRAVLLEQGVVQREGTPEEVLDFYNARIAQRSASGGMQILVRDEADGSALGTQRSGNFRAVITGVEFRNAKGDASETFVSGEDAALAVRVLFLEDINDPTVGVLIRNRLGIEVFGLNTKGLGRRLGNFRAGESMEVTLSFPLNLGPDDYSITVAAHEDETHLLNNFDWVDKAWRFRVVGGNDYQFYGLAKLCPELAVTKGESARMEDVDRSLRSLLGDSPETLSGGVGDDRFFLEGWRVGEERGVGRVRMIDGRGRFAYVARGGGLVVEGGSKREELRKNMGHGQEACASDAGGGTRGGMWLSWVGGEARGELVGGNAWEFVLPGEVVGKMMVYSLRFEGEGERGFSVGVIRSEE